MQCTSETIEQVFEGAVQCIVKMLRQGCVRYLASLLPWWMSYLPDLNGIGKEQLFIDEATCGRNQKYMYTHLTIETSISTLTSTELEPRSRTLARPVWRSAFAQKQQPLCLDLCDTTTPHLTPHSSTHVHRNRYSLR